MIIIRPAQPIDYSTLPLIEEDAAQAFGLIGLAQIQSMPVTPDKYYHSLTKNSGIFVAVDGFELVGFIALIPVDQQGFVKEVSVRQSYAGQGIGRRLLQQAFDWATIQGFNWLILTTFRDIPFNGVFYQKLGFKIFVPDQKWPELSALRQSETDSGLDIIERVTMRLQLVQTT